MNKITIYDPKKKRKEELDLRSDKMTVMRYLFNNGYDPNEYGIKCGCIYLHNLTPLNYYAELTLNIYKK